MGASELSVKVVPVNVPPICVQPSVPLGERSSLYDTVPPAGAVHDSEILVADGLVPVKAVGELGSVVTLFTDDGTETPDALTADTL